MDREEFDSVKLGERIGFVYGPGEFPEHHQGTVTAKREDEWGLHVDVKMDYGNTTSVDADFTKSGVGCYRLALKNTVTIKPRGINKELGFSYGAEGSG